MNLLAACVLAACLPAAADLVLYGNDFTTTPPGWTITTSGQYNYVNFTSAGAHSHSIATGSAYYSNGGLGVVPEGTEYLNISASQLIHLHSTGSCISAVSLLIWVNGSYGGQVYGSTTPNTDITHPDRPSTWISMDRSTGSAPATQSASFWRRSSITWGAPTPSAIRIGRSGTSSSPP